MYFIFLCISPKLCILMHPLNHNTLIHYLKNILVKTNSNSSTGWQWFLYSLSGIFDIYSLVVMFSL